MTIQYKIIALLLALIGASVGIYFFGQHRYDQGDADATLRAGKAIADLKVVAANDLAREILKTKSVEDLMASALHDQELKDANNHKTVEVLSTYIRTLVGDAGRLRDPNQAAGCGDGGGSTAGQTFANASSGAADGGEAGGLLSTQLTGLLQRITREADDVNSAYASCRADAIQVRANETP